MKDSHDMGIRGAAALLITLLLLITVSSGCGSNKDNREEGLGKTFPSSNTNPLEHIFEILNLNNDDLVRPLYLEEGYHLICRNSLIDRMARSPFILQEWADNTSDSLQQNADSGIADILQFTFKTLNNGELSEHLNFDYSEFTEGFEASYIEIFRANNKIPADSSLKLIKQAKFSKEFDRKTGNLLYNILKGSILLKDAIAGLSKEDERFIETRPELFFFPDSISFNFLTAPVHVQKRIVSISRKIDFNGINKAGLLISRAVDDLCNYSSQAKSEGGSSRFFIGGMKKKGVLLKIPSPIGDIVFLGGDDNEFKGSGALVVDLGGNDSYLGQIASGNKVPGRIAIAIDIEGDDTFGKSGMNHSNGFGCLSIGMLIDIKGNDKYLGGDMGQGSGMFGIGVLQDKRGNDTYQMGMMGQGFAVFGTGLLLDKNGNDKYIIRGMGQGCGSSMGIGVLCDTNGDDTYIANRNANKTKLVADEWCHAQGAGLSIRSPDWKKYPSLYGGIGFLSDGQGNDTYYASHGNTMGSSYFMSVGALVDHNGNDKYLPQNGYSLAFAVHLSNAVLIDRSGNDYYFAKSETGGAASDRSTAILADYKGDDIYGPTLDHIKETVKKEMESGESKLAESELNNAAQQKMADISYGSAKKPKALGF
ncbi:MAG: hypothetical protein JRF40_12980, partial [Deltaproteobacteria bacterium]|nr:hypothetical protein [Deltaproteobacteria bacterium]